MAGKKRMRMRGVKQTPKRLEEEILSRAKALEQNPGLLRPMCAGNCRKCAFTKTFKKIDDLSKYIGDESALLKMASKGSDDIVKAYAGTISMSAAGKIPLLATATLAGEKVPFAVRGSIGNDKMIGCQYYTDPKIRLLLYNQFIKSEKLHLYSFGENIVCSDDPNMPEDYLYDTFWETPYEFKDDGLDCGHKGSISLNIHIKSLNETIHICEDCAKEVSTGGFVISRMCAVNPMDDITVEVHHSFHSAGSDGIEKIEGDDLVKYVRGILNDVTLLGTVKQNMLKQLSDSGCSTFIIGGKNYGSDIDAFFKDIDGPQESKDRMKTFLRKLDTSVVIKNGKIAEIFALFWNDKWKDIIEIFTDAETASQYAERPKASYDLVLKEACELHESASVLKSIPRFEKLPKVAKIADSLAVAVKVGGLEYGLKKIRELPIRDATDKAVAASFVLVCDKSARPPFNLSPKDLEFAEFLVPYTKAVIDATGEEYRNRMNVLLTSCGSGESL